MDFECSWKTTTSILDLVKELGPFVLGIAVFVATCWFQASQVHLSRQKLRHELYDRRFAIYTAFQELLVGLLEKGEDDIKTLFRKAGLACSEALFLFDDPKLQSFLEQIYNQVTAEVISSISFLDAMKENGVLINDPQIVRDVAERAMRLGTAKLTLAERHLRELPQQFGKFLKLTDFLK
jgi:hypothetical protein